MQFIKHFCNPPSTNSVGPGPIAFYEMILLFRYVEVICYELKKEKLGVNGID